MKFVQLIITFLLTTSIILSDDTGAQHFAYEMLNIKPVKHNNAKKVKIAVIDDGFRLSHNKLKKYIYSNPDEVVNYRDDDNNGYIDDINGWDASDNDNIPAIPFQKESIYYHGTFMAGIIINIFERFYGDDAHKYLSIIPIKSIADNSKSKLLDGAYNAVKYAISCGADVICCAWSGGNPDDDDLRRINQAINSNIIFVGSAGNLFSETLYPPANIPGVIAVSGVDYNYHKFSKSSYGMKIDIVAIADSVFGAHPDADNAYFFEKGTSNATAIISGCFGVLKSLSYSSDSESIKDALMMTAKPLDQFNSTYSGKLGAGFPDMSKAVEYLLNPSLKYQNHNPELCKGKLFFGKNKKIITKEINPVGNFKGLHIIPYKISPNVKFKVFSDDSVYFDGKGKDFKYGVFAADSRVFVQSEPIKSEGNSFVLSYYVETLDSSSFYCSGEVLINNESGTISDGSGDFDYANRTACKWIITVPENKQIKLDFTKMDTEPNIDFIYIYDGDNTLKENLLAMFSGSSKPPTIISNTNQVLVWFLSNDFKTGDGWELRYQAINSPN